MDVVRLLPDVLFRCYKAEDGKIYWSLNEGGLAEQFGLTTKEIEGKSLDELFPGGASDALHQHFEDAFNGKVTIFTNEIEGRHFRHYPQPVFDKDGNVTEVVGFIAEVTELVETERALQAANRELEAFAYTASHDFRGPLSTMRIDAVNLLNQLPEDSPEWKSAQRIQRSADRLATMVDGLLQLSRANQDSLDRRPVDIANVARSIAANLEEQDLNRHVTWDIAETLPVQGDPALIESAVQNLLENAWKYTSDATDAHISVQAAEDGFIEISDNGSGFDPEEADAIFEAFTRLDKKRPGSGIGLATVKRIMERHGGTIEAIGRPGSGSTFRFHLPVDAE